MRKETSEWSIRMLADFQSCINMDDGCQISAGTGLVGIRSEGE